MISLFYLSDGLREAIFGCCVGQMLEVCRNGKTFFVHGLSP